MPKEQHSSSGVLQLQYVNNRKVQQSRNLRQTMGKNGKAAVLEYYNIEKYSKHYIEQYQKTLIKKPMNN